MKVQTLVLAASAALILSAQGVAQSDTGLERALTELNAGLTAPVGSASMAISGDARIRNVWDVHGDRKNLDARARLNFDFNVNESVSASVGFSRSENWDNAGADSTASAATAMDRFSITANNLIGDGGSFKIGEDYFTMGSGRIIGSDDWDNSPTVDNGIWYSNGSFGLFLRNGDGGDDNYGVNFDYSFNMPGIGDITMRPYLLGSVGGDGGGTSFSTSGYGSELSGTFAGFAWEGEYATQDGGGAAWTASTSISIDMLGSIPGITSGAVDLSTSSADDDFTMAGEANTWNQTGLGQGALWAAGNDFTSAGVSFSPVEGWNGRLALNSLNDATQWDFTASTTLVGAVDVWVGYANADGDNTIYSTMSVNF